MGYGVVLEKVRALDGKDLDKFTFPSIHKLRQFLVKEWKLATSSVKEIVPKARSEEIEKIGFIPVEFKDEGWKITFVENKLKKTPKREKIFADANFNRLEIRMYSHLPDIISLLETEKERVETAKEFMKKAYETMKGFPPKEQNYKISIMDDLERSLDTIRDYYFNLERRIERGKASQ